MGGTLDYNTRFHIKTTLVAGTLKNVAFFMIIEFAAEVGTRSGKRPTLVVSIKEDKFRGDQKAGSSYRLVYLNVLWFFGNFEAGKL